MAKLEGGGKKNVPHGNIIIPSFPQAMEEEEEEEEEGKRKNNQPTSSHQSSWVTDAEPTNQPTFWNERERGGEEKSHLATNDEQLSFNFPHGDERKREKERGGEETTAEKQKSRSLET